MSKESEKYPAHLEDASLDYGHLPLSEKSANDVGAYIDELQDAQHQDCELIGRLEEEIENYKLNLHCARDIETGLRELISRFVKEAEDALVLLEQENIGEGTQTGIKYMIQKAQKRLKEG